MAVENTVSSQGSLLPPILRLPPEIRLKIYRLLLLSDQTVRMMWLKDSDSFPRPNCLFPAILRTCRVFYNEAADVLYGENVFRAHRIDDTNDNTLSGQHFSSGTGRLSGFCCGFPSSTCVEPKVRAQWVTLA